MQIPIPWAFDASYKHYIKFSCLCLKKYFSFTKKKKNENLTGKQCTKIKMDIMLSLSIPTQEV
jgi:hypothetical protein